MDGMKIKILIIIGLFTMILVISYFSLISNNSEKEYKIDYFIDANGYTPEWAKNIENNQALGKCRSLVPKDFKNSDKLWCAGLHEFVIGKLNP